MKLIYEAETEKDFKSQQMSLEGFIGDYHKVNYEEMLKLYIYARHYDHQEMNGAMVTYIDF